jgi:hypothetical protein
MYYHFYLFAVQFYLHTEESYLMSRINLWNVKAFRDWIKLGNFDLDLTAQRTVLPNLRRLVAGPSFVMWDLWWTKWRWARFSPRTSLSPANLHSTNCSTIPMIYHLGLVQQASSDCTKNTAQRGIVELLMNWKELGKTQSWVNRRTTPAFSCTEWIKHKNLIRITGVLADIWTKNLSNRNLEAYC